MTYASFETSHISNKANTAAPAILLQSVASVIRTMFSVILAKRPIDADSILSAQARRETARRSVDNLLR